MCVFTVVVNVARNKKEEVEKAEEGERKEIKMTKADAYCAPDVIISMLMSTL